MTSPDIEPDPVTHWLRSVETALQNLLGGGFQIRTGWPRWPGPSEFGPGVTLRLGGPADWSGAELALRVDQGMASALVDRALGGEGSAGPAVSCAPLTDAELGVLAYLAARAVRELPPLWVREVDTGAPRMREGALLWPIDLALGPIRGAGQLAIDRRDSLPRAPVIRLQVGVTDTLKEADLTALQAGDVLTGPRFAFLHARSGLVGPCTVRLPGAGSFEGRLDGCALRLTGRQEPQPDASGTTRRAFWVLHEADTQLDQLAALARGDALQLPPPAAPQALQVQGWAPAETECVRKGAQVGARITALPAVIPPPETRPPDPSDKPR